LSQNFEQLKIEVWEVSGRVENQAGERKDVAKARLSELLRTAVPTVSGFVRVLKGQKMVTTLFHYFKKWVETNRNKWLV